MSKTTNYYKILGVGQQADETAIKRAYRQLALKYHPDRNPGNTYAEDRFKQVTEAYRILSDRRKRADYDRKRSDRSSSANNKNSSHWTRSSNDDLFDVFGNFSSRKGASRKKYQQPIRGADLKHELSVDFEESALGTTKTIELKRMEQCERCRGTGIEPRSYPMLCPTCLGKGRTRQSHGFLGFTQVCPDCNGSGRVYQKECPQCRGESRVLQQRRISVKIPSNVHDGMSLKVEGEGESGSYGGSPGDLYIQVHVKAHDFFGRKDNDIWCEMPLTITQAILGGVVEVPTLENKKVRIRIPPGTQCDRVFRLSRKGVPLSSNGHRGDFYVKMKIQIPTKISRRQRQLLEEFARISDEDASTPASRLLQHPKEKISAWLQKVFGVKESSRLHEETRRRH
ncbi:molecular chaperone DnaJ [candidate division KSB3 bacterium]|uniref:Chaperone protein DnaJ n=1 Tax=candidate division KSB3 bacterium TaxID=2044937 RepID=A0A2G6E599_9BACT|nr:MAG: molecular chaperone DnaJ [candidate division KSB3 bacterium]PIE29729.1 MAG: molecular chaperone DnaJ [candidate division KSB3 bacterium]